MKKFLASVLAITSIFACIGMASCGGNDKKYVATELQTGAAPETYGYAIGKNSSNKEAILTAMNTVIDEITADMQDIITYYTDLANGNASTVTLEFPDLSDNTEGTLQVYTNVGFEPFEFVDDDQNIVGVDMYVMQLVAEEMNMKVNFTSIDFNAITVKLAEEDNAIGAAGITITDERKETVDFSNPYFSTIQCVISEEGSPIGDFEGLKGKKIGVQKGTTGALLIADAIENGALKDSGATIVEYTNGPLAFAAMKAGKCDVVVIDKLPAVQLVK